LSQEKKEIDLPTPTLLKAKLESYRHNRTLLAKTQRLDIYSASKLDILLHGYESSTVDQLLVALEEEYGQDAENEIDKTFEANLSPERLLWLFSLPQSPFGQVSFYLKDGRYIGHCRFYIPEGENITHVRGDHSGNPQGLRSGYAELSIHFLDAFTGQGYGSEGLHMALETLIKPRVGTHPLVYAGVDAANKVQFKPSHHPFLGLATVTGLTNLASLRSTLKAGMLPADLVTSQGELAGYIGYMNMGYPNPSPNSEQLSQFLAAWLCEVTRLAPEIIKQSWIISRTEEGYECNQGLRPELLLVYHKLMRQFTVTKPHSNEELLQYEARLNALHNHTLKKALPSLAGKPVELIWQYMGKPVSIKEQIIALPAIEQAHSAFEQKPIKAKL